VLCQADDGPAVGQGDSPHPAGTACDPAALWAALQQPGVDLLRRAAGIGVAGQQRGMIVLAEDARVIKPQPAASHHASGRSCRPSGAHRDRVI
jgi:xylulokinase